MGYDLHITGAEDWLEAEEHPIGELEWMAIVNSDPTLQISDKDYFERKTEDGRTERIHPGLWITHPDKAPFWYYDGAIKAKNPDETTVRKMVEIARKLGANVFGDDREEYK